MEEEFEVIRPNTNIVINGGKKVTGDTFKADNNSDITKQLLENKCIKKYVKTEKVNANE